MAQAEGVYLYGVTPAGCTLGVLANETLEIIPHGAIQVVTTRVALGEWVAGALGDPLVLAERVRHHDAVLQRVMCHCTPLPMRLATIVRGLGEVRAWLADQHDLLERLLASFQGRQEWGLKLLPDEALLAEEAAQVMGPAAEAGGEGARFLLRKQRERALAQSVGAAMRGMMAEVREAFAPLSEARAPLPARRGHVLNEALLVPVSNISQLTDQQAAINARLAGRGSVMVTGPWPPYSFVPCLLEPSHDG